MTFKATKSVLAMASLVAGISLPAFAQSATTQLSEANDGGAKFERRPNMVAHRQGGWSKDGQRGGCSKGGHRGGSHGKHRSMFGSLKGEFAVTPEQYEKLFAIKNQFRDQIAPKVAELKADGKQMRDLMTQPNVDKSQIQALQSRINTAKESLTSIMLDSKLQQLSVLTPAQRQELRKKFVEHSVNSGRG